MIYVPLRCSCQKRQWLCFGLILASLQSKVRELYDVVCRLEGEKYDWEFKLRKVDFEVRSLRCVRMPTS